MIPDRKQSAFPNVNHNPLSEIDTEKLVLDFIVFEIQQKAFLPKDLIKNCKITTIFITTPERDLFSC